MPLPFEFIKHLQEKLYNSRSDKHSNVFSECIVADLLRSCPTIAQKAAAGKLVYDLNVEVMVGTSQWNVDLVLGTPALGQTALPTSPSMIVRSRPATILVAIEHKAVMTEHHKAVKNRKRDLDAHVGHAHAYNPATYAGAVLLVNGSERFKSTTRDEDDITTHRNVGARVAHCVAEIRAAATRHGPRGDGLDGKCVIVVDCDNMNPETFRYITEAPAPQLGDPMYYDAFIQSMCNYFTQHLQQYCP